jgi:hypothetical protein
MPGLPVTWPELLADAETRERYAERLSYLIEDAGEGAAAPETLLARGGDTLMALALLEGPAATAPGFDALRKAGAAHGGVDWAIAKARPDAPLMPINALTAANVGGVCGAEGFVASLDEARTLLAPAVEQVRTLGDGMRYRAAFAATAYGLHDLAATFAFGKPRAGDFTPGEAFEANPQALVHYLIQADVAGASVLDF